MGKFTIEFDERLPWPGASADMHVRVSHLAARKAVIPPQGLQPSLSPGVVLVLPAMDMGPLQLECASIRLYEGDVLVLDGQVPDRINCIPDVGVVHDAEPTVLLLELAAVIDSERELVELLATPSLIESHLRTNATRLCRDLQLTIEQGHGQGESRGTLVHALVSHLISILLITEGDIQNATRTPRGPEELKSLLAAQLDRNFGTAELAERFCMSRSCFCLWSKRVLGTTPMLYRRKLRIERSQEMLRHTSSSIEHIAEQVGFSNRYYFSRAFRAQCGLPPAEYRELHKREPGPQSPYVLYRNNRFQRALDACDDAMASTTDKGAQQKLLYLKAQCLSALGNHDEAMGIWSHLRGSPQARQAGMQMSRTLFVQTQYDQALMELEHVYKNGDPLEQEQVINAWMDQVRVLLVLRAAQPLRSYLDFRKRCFIRDPKTLALASHVLYMLGDYDAQLEDDVMSPVEMARIHYQAGNYEETMALVPSAMRVRFESKIAYAQCRYKEILSMEAAPPQQKAAALLRLNRAADVLKRFPDERVAAYIALGDYERVLDSAETESQNRVYALRALGRTEELRHTGTVGSWLWHEAQLHSQPEAILHSSFPDTPEFVHFARVLTVLDSLLTANKQQAETHLCKLQGVEAPDFFWHDHRTVCVLVSAGLRAELLNRDILPATLTYIVKHFRYCEAQLPWHAAKYLLGEISLAQYRKQPNLQQATDLLPFLQAFKADMAGETRKAFDRYEKLLSTTRPYGREGLLICRFSEWRLSRANSSHPT